MSEDSEQTLIIFKPDAMQRHLHGKLLKLWADKGYTVVGSRLIQPTIEQMTQHYIEHKDKPFFDALIKRMTAAPCWFFVMQGPSVIKWSRAKLGATDPTQADPHSIRGSLATHYTENLVHASDSTESAKRELQFWAPFI